jgi:Transposase IS4
MVPPQDARRVIGARVCTKSIFVTARAECARQFGSAASSKYVDWTVLEVIVERPNGRAHTSLNVNWDFPSGAKHKRVLLSNIETADPAFGSPLTEGDAVHAVQTSSVREKATLGKAGAVAYSCRPSDYSNRLTPTAVVHGQEWYEEEVRIPIGGPVMRRPWSVRRLQGDIISESTDFSSLPPYDYFLAMFPYAHLGEIARLTNIQLLQQKCSLISVGELLKFFGVLVLMTRFEFGKRHDLWKTSPSSKYIPAPAFGKTVTSRNRFDQISGCIRFSDQLKTQEELKSVRYRWMLVNDFVSAVNTHRRTIVTPSELICVDESIARWYGRGGHWIDMDLPHYVSIDRKPENGCEVQNAACGKSGIMLNIRLVTTADDEARWTAEIGDTELGHGTALLSRLVQPWAGTGRIVCADSYFASVEAAEVMGGMCLKFIGVVKTAMKRYPMAILSGRELSHRVERVSLVAKSTSGEVKMMVMTWVDRDRRYFIATTSCTLDGESCSRARWRQLEDRPERVELVVPQPQATEVYYTACAQIDRHNLCRQADLDLEKKVGTHDWSFRVNCTVLRMIVVDAWLVYSGGCGIRTRMDQRAFYEQLADQLIDNSFDSVRLRDRPSALVTPGVPTRSGIGAHLTPTKKKRKRKSGTSTTFALQGKCCICSAKTTHICSSCLDDRAESGSIWLCHSKNNRHCFGLHLRAHHS